MTRSTAMHHLWHLLQTSDATFPVGGFAHSFGLEGLVQASLIDTPDDLEAFLASSWAPQLAHIDFPLIRLAYTHAAYDDAIFRLDQLAWACRATAEARKAQEHIGRQRLKLIAALTGHSRLNDLHHLAEQQRWRANTPVVIGVESACLNLPVEHALLACGYQSVNGLLGASAKLIRIGPSGIQHILARSRALIEDALHQSNDIGEEDIGWFSPVLDITGACHETAYTRLFIS